MGPRPADERRDLSGPPPPWAVGRLRAGGSVFAEDEAALLVAEATSSDALEAMVARRVAGEPIEHVVGWAAFAGLRLVVAPGVFVPRRRSETLADRAAARLAPGAVVVDLCCGVAPLGAALVAAEPSIELHVADVDPVALDCARRNLPPTAAVHHGDLYAALPSRLVGHVHVIVANAPYVPTTALGSLPAEARHHEPTVALDGGHDGLAVHRRVAADAPRWLRPGGHLLVEVADHQAEPAVALVRRAGLDARVERDDDLDVTVVVATAP